MNKQKYIKSKADKCVHLMTNAGQGFVSSKAVIDRLDQYLSEVSIGFDRELFLEIVEKSLIEIQNLNQQNFQYHDSDFEDIFYSINVRKIDNRKELGSDMETKELAVLNQYIDDLNERLDKLNNSHKISLELIEELKNELEEVRIDFETFTKKQSKRAFIGTLTSISKMLLKAGMKNEEITKIVKTGIENPSTILEENGMQTLKLVSEII